LSKHPSGETLRKIRYNSGYYVYGSLLNGGEYKSDPMMEAAGFRFTISSDSFDHARGVVIRYKRKLFDVTTGEMKDDPEEKMIYSFADRNPDEIVSFMQGLFKRHLEENAALRKIYKDQHPQLRTMEDLLRERERAKLLSGN
jgi:hypothetical protein